MHNGPFAVIGAMTRALAFLAVAGPRGSSNAARATCDMSVQRPFIRAIARAEGWDVFDCGLHPDGSPHVEIQRPDDPDNGPPVFADDADAWQHVVWWTRSSAD